MIRALFEGLFSQWGRPVPTETSSSSGSKKVEKKWVVVLGYSSVGKDKLLERIVWPDEPFSHEPSVAGPGDVGIMSKVCNKKDSDKLVKVHFFIYSGVSAESSVLVTQILPSLRPLPAGLVLLLYDVRDRKTLDLVDLYMADVPSQMKARNADVFLVGTKTDTEPGGRDREVASEEGQAKALEIGARYFETSAKTRKGVRELESAIVSVVGGELKEEPHWTKEEHPKSCPIIQKTVLTFLLAMQRMRERCRKQKGQTKEEPHPGGHPHVRREITGDALGDTQCVQSDCMRETVESPSTVALSHSLSLYICEFLPLKNNTPILRPRVALPCSHTRAESTGNQWMGQDALDLES
uniref:Uncharacterized protein n=1 Tax=Chromera velia CCMP2878 TaxID=1169474 RepID=A0A0G4FCY4_9ALVE|eukprot:Cvel_16272.t1-p1 / transcript=Cvel_16272.t1 / gene=Cvel_16272 / organism=Chromera_velia_CCMP2878 / gene_product=Ras-related protein Rab-6.2, putative / transcript_product=Ras-related protein Rab-6.2, putative / location=Cvel_scaffold1245:46077-47129(-) / protein_length=351 / sequence_SO=supercontig / SO=protein_coding / is_pseudo=false